MALAPKLKETGINKAGNEYYISDDTGVYNLDTNPGGYGTPNKERSEVAVICLVTYRSSNGDVPLKFQAYDPETVTSFTLNLDRDGWFEVRLYQIDKYSDLVTYSPSAITFDPAADTIQKWDGTAWSQITERDLISETSLVYAIKDRFLPVQATKYLNKLTKIINETPPSKQKEEFMFLYDEIYQVILGSNSDFCDGLKYHAQKTIELLSAHRIKL